MTMNRRLCPSKLQLKLTQKHLLSDGTNTVASTARATSPRSSGRPRRSILGVLRSLRQLLREQLELRTGCSRLMAAPSKLLGPERWHRRSIKARKRVGALRHFLNLVLCGILVEALNCTVIRQVFGCRCHKVSRPEIPRFRYICELAVGLDAFTPVVGAFRTSRDRSR